MPRFPARFGLFLLPLLLAACGDGASNSSTPAAPVAAAKPPAGQQWTDVVEKVDLGYRMGNPNAPIKLVEYGARSCPTCGAFGREGQRPLEEKYVSTGKVSYEFHDFLVHGASDLPGSLLGPCGGPGAFFPLLEAMYANQNDYLDRLQKMPADVQAKLRTASPLEGVMVLAETGGMIDLVKQRGIPEQKARACLADQKLLEALAKSTEKLGADGTVTGTPSFFINGERVDATNWQGVEAALKAAGA